MSIKAISWALDIETGAPATKLVLIKLADNANDVGKCWPSIAHICKHTELSERWVRTSIRKLAEAGLIRIEERFADGVQLPHLFHLQMDQKEAGVVHSVQGGGALSAPGVVHSVHPEVNRQSKPSIKPNPETSLRDVPDASDLFEPEKEAKKPREPKRGSLLPDGVPTQTMKDLACAHWEQHGRGDLAAGVEAQAEQFADYHTAHGTRSKDWAASWRTWMRNALTMTRPPLGQPALVVPIFEQTDERGWLERAARFLGLGSEPSGDGQTRTPWPLGGWMRSWGRAPGEDGCKMPSPMLAKVRLHPSYGPACEAYRKSARKAV